MAEQAPVRIRGCVVKQIGDKAVLVGHANWKKPKWFPDSQIHDDSELYMKSPVGEQGTLVVTRWIAEQKGLV